MEYGESRKIVEIEKNENFEITIKKTKNVFGIESKIALQEYDEAWEAWLDLKDRQKLRLVVCPEVEQVSISTVLAIIYCMQQGGGKLVEIFHG